MSILEWIVLPLIGALGGFLAGMLGVGGGIIFIPVLTWLFEKNGLSNSEIVKFTLANSMLLVFVSGVSGIFRQIRTASLDIKKMLWIGIPGAIVSLGWSFLIQRGNWYDKRSFQLVFLGFLIISISNMVFGKSNKENVELIENEKTQTWHIFLVAILAGTVVALSGLGGGVIMVPLFRMLLKMPMHKATALSLSIIPLLTIVPLISYVMQPDAAPVTVYQSGYIAWNYIFPIAITVAFFASFGLRTAKAVPVRVLRLIFAALSTIVFIQTIYNIFKK